MESKIKLIPKNNKEIKGINDLRPISLTNFEYRILTKILANRFRSIAHKIINDHQTCSIFERRMYDNIWLLNDLYVEEANRGQGIASKLMETAESAAREAGATRVFLRTANDNTTAQSLYEGRGYLQDEVFRRYDLIF